MRDPRERVSPLSYEEAVRRLDALEPEPGAGQCSIWGCWRPAQGLAGSARSTTSSRSPSAATGRFYERRPGRLAAK